MAVSIPKKPKLGEILVKRNTLSPDQLNMALDGQGSTMLPVGSTVIQLGLAGEIAVTLALSEQWGVPGVDLKASVIATNVLSVVPEEVAISHRVLPLRFEAQSLHLAVANPGDRALLDEIAFASGRGTLPFIVPRIVLDESIRAAYRARSDRDTVWAGPRAAGTEPEIVVIQPEKPAEDPDTKVQEEPEITPSVLESFPAAPTIEKRDSDKPCVLVVDDEPEILDIIEKALSHRGIEVVRAMRGREALEKLRTTMPDMVLLDAMLPEIHGFEICSTIKKSKQFEHIPVIMISAIYTGWNLIQDVKRVYGADDYITKPFRIVELVRRVEEVLNKEKKRPAAPDVQVAQKEVARSLKSASESFKAGRIEDSIDAARQAIEADPLEPRAHFMLGTALHRSGQVYEAISEYERVVELAPNQFNALKSLAVLYERQGFKAKAVEMWMRALEQSPSDAVRITVKAHLLDLL